MKKLLKKMKNLKKHTMHNNWFGQNGFYLKKLMLRQHYKNGFRVEQKSKEVQDLYKENISSVLANATKHGNNAVTNPVLKDNVNKIIKK